MKTAVFKDKLVTPEQFVNMAPRWKQGNEHADCPLCWNRVHPYGAHSPNVTSRFDHEDGVTWCPNSNTADPRYKNLRPSEVDLEQARLLRAVFLGSQNVQRAFEFCRYLVGKGFDEATFSGLIAQADRINIWSYKRIPLWVIPYVFLTLDNFTVSGKNGNFTVAFRLLKPAAGTIDDLWIEPHKCKLVKLFPDSEKLCQYPEGNPFPLDELTLWTLGDPSFNTE